MSQLGIVLVTVGAVIAAIWFITTFNAARGPKETRVIAIRAWLTAFGPIVALGTLSVAVWSLSIAQQSLLSADRPWVGLDGVTMASPVAGSSPKATVVLKNSGRSPAMDLRIFAEGQALESFKDPPSIPDMPKGEVSVGMLLPGAIAEVYVWKSPDDKPLSELNAKAITDGHLRLWISARIQYRDAFGNSHETTFQNYYETSSSAFVASFDGKTHAD